MMCQGAVLCLFSPREAPAPPWKWHGRGFYLGLRGAWPLSEPGEGLYGRVGRAVEELGDLVAKSLTGCYSV